MQRKNSEKHCIELSGSLAGATHYNFSETWNPKNIVFKEGVGSRLVDIDGNSYLDFYSNFGSNILGHGHKEYMRQIFQDVSRISSSSLSDLSYEVSEKICSFLPSADLVRFSVTGTEAVQTAIRLARAYTGKQKFLRFTGNYHGHTDNMLGGKPSEGGCPHPVDFEGDARASKGLAQGVREAQSILIPWNDLSTLENVLQHCNDDIACIITEPLAVNGGGIAPLPGYLEGMRKLCDQYGIVLIFDEIITGFRVGFGGAQGLYDVTPDLTTLGKALAGGMMPVSAIAGRQEIMSLLTKNEVVHAGTFNGYHAGLSAVKAALNVLQSEKSHLDNALKNGQRLINIFKDRATHYGMPLTVQSHPSCFYLHVTDQELTATEQWNSAIKNDDVRLQTNLLNEGIILAPTSRCYPSVSLTDEDVELFEERADRAFESFARQYNNDR